ncbi:VWA domain-containing protein [Nocardioides sp. zg-1228]|uniref:VWA domain-containing protein n=1 Tax=Nocardioides sp. zg-1228 TaxID=2763008 RepID=UPI001642F7E4|nr:VWA domain-containing protein [Nocardioides sp. zg-1228]MBC2933754.1 substrate-binding domain-containing protein [Nocardioides sp. zg-1228]QSF58531.1 substrate-binding domain-containing protein [Nocardioides sp. zg-1228]
MQTSHERGGGRATSRSTAVLAVVVLVTGLAVGAGATWLALSRPGSSTDSTGCEGFRGLDLAVAPEMYGAVVAALADVTPDCVQVDPAMRSGVDVARSASMGGALPDVWIPEAHFLTATAYLGSARPRLLVRSLARTRVVLVGGAAARRFASWGDAEASGLVTVPDPGSSAAGALAVTAPEAEARVVGRSRADARRLVVPFAQAQSARAVRGQDESVGPAMFARRSPRLVVSTEQQLRTVSGRDDLRDLTPAVGAPVLDFPLLVSGDAAPGARALARALAQHLRGEAGRALIADEGLRAPGTGRGDLRPPAAPTIARAVQSWNLWSVPSAMLAVVDASGSMDLDTGMGSRMDLLADAARIGLGFLPDHARVGLWVFSEDKGGPGRDWRELEPIRRLDDLRFGRTQRYALRERAAELPGLTDGGTGLYDTALAAYREALRSYRPHYANAVVLMTDGRNEDPGSITLTALLRRLGELRDPQRPVRLVGIAISGDADLAALRRMARVTGGEAYLAAQPEDVLGVFAQAVLSR